MDGDFDYSQLSRSQLEEALTRIDKRRYPVNYQRILKELETRPPEASSAQPVEASPSLVSLIGWYSTGLVVAHVLAYMSAGFIAAYVNAVLRPRDAFPDGPIPPLIASVLAIVAPLAVYSRLARNHPQEFLRAAIGVAAVASLILTAIPHLISDRKLPAPMTVFIAMLTFNFGVASLMGTLSLMRQVKPPSSGS